MQMIEGTAAQQTGNGRIKALAAATAAMAGANAARDIATNGPGIGISLTAGHAESVRHETTASAVHNGSVLAVRNNVAISATGAGKDSNVDIVGRDVSTKRNISLLADNQVNLLAAQETDCQHTKNTRNSAAVGIAALASTKGVAYGTTGRADGSSGSADGDGITQVNSHATAGDKLLTMTASGGDTNY